MATCSIGELQTQACANGFGCIAQTPDVANAVTLQLLKNIGGGTENLGDLVEDACENNFLCVSQSPRLFQAVALQLLCNISGG